MTEFRYKAFISYSHKNNRQAVWLMKKLEAFRIPRHLDKSGSGEAKRKKLGKMFRDREELPASTNMDGNIRSALKDSEYLIVVCSTDAARSSRVNNEIRQFIQHRDSRKILCLIVDGEPNFEVAGLADYQGCIPSELRKLRLVTGQTPLAADARTEGDGKQRGLQKIIAGLLEVDLDVLLRRDSRRRYSRLVAVALASFLATLVTTGLMVRANLAEDAAKQALSEAENQTARAEDLITFMLDDLAGNRLQELGRVEVMDAVVEKIVDHYESQDDSSLSPSALARKARSYIQLGRLYLGRDLRDPASGLFERAEKATNALLTRHPESVDARYAHLVSLQWVGTNHIFNGRYSEAETVWRERVRVGQELFKHEGLKQEVRAHLGDMNIHLGWALMELGRINEALEQFRVGLNIRQSNADSEPKNAWWLNPLGGGFYHLQWAQLHLAQLEDALANMRKSRHFYQRLAEEDPSDQRAVANYARSLRWLAETEILVGADESAKENLNLSIKLHDQLLSFEPDNKRAEYQGCVSTVVLAEIYWIEGNGDAVVDVLNNGCSAPDGSLSLDHFKAHQRFYGYKLELLRLEMAVADRDTGLAAQVYQRIHSRWRHETEEVRNSLNGRHVALSLAIQRIALNDLNISVPNAHQQLADVVTNSEASFVVASPIGTKLLQKARQLVRQHSIKNEIAR